MTAWAFCLAYNEALMIRYWVRHYRTVCDKLIVYLDQDTDDDSQIIAEQEGAEVRSYTGTSKLDDIAFIEFAQEHYKEARGQADWVMWTDVDEIIYHPQLVDRLDELHTAGVNVPTIAGYGMVSYSPPATYGQIYDEIQTGFEMPVYAKLCVFDPALDVRWTTGKHEAGFSGGVVCRDDGSDPLKLLHYRWLGEEYHLARNQRNFARVNELNRAYGHGRETYPDSTAEYSPSWYRQHIQLAKVCI